MRHLVNLPHSVDHSNNFSLHSLPPSCVYLFACYTPMLCAGAPYLSSPSHPQNSKCTHLLPHLLPPFTLTIYMFFGRKEGRTKHYSSTCMWMWDQNLHCMNRLIIPSLPPASFFTKQMPATACLLIWPQSGGNIAHAFTYLPHRHLAPSFPSFPFPSPSPPSIHPQAWRGSVVFVVLPLPPPFPDPISLPLYLFLLQELEGDGGGGRGRIWTLCMLCLLPAIVTCLSLPLSLFPSLLSLLSLLSHHLSTWQWWQGGEGGRREKEEQAHPLLLSSLLSP